MEYRKTIEFKKFSIDLTNEWVQFFEIKKWNWIDFNFIHFSFENDRTFCENEIEIILLGFGIRVYWDYRKPKDKKRIKRLLKKPILD
jgi:hypothetical protein